MSQCLDTSLLSRSQFSHTYMFGLAQQTQQQLFKCYSGMEVSFPLTDALCAINCDFLGFWRCACTLHLIHSAQCCLPVGVTLIPFFFDLPEEGCLRVVRIVCGALISFGAALTFFYARPCLPACARDLDRQRVTDLKTSWRDESEYGLTILSGPQFLMGCNDKTKARHAFPLFHVAPMALHGASPCEPVKFITLPRST